MTTARMMWLLSLFAVALNATLTVTSALRGGWGWLLAGAHLITAAAVALAIWRVYRRRP